MASADSKESSNESDDEVKETRFWELPKKDIYIDPKAPFLTKQSIERHNITYLKALADFYDIERPDDSEASKLALIKDDRLDENNAPISFDQFTSISANDQKTYLQLFQKYSQHKVDVNEITPERMLEVEKLADLHGKVTIEQELFVKYMKENYANRIDIYDNLQFSARKYIKELCVSKLRLSLKYPCWYKYDEIIQFWTQEKILKETPMSFNLDKVLLTLGIVHSLVVPNPKLKSQILPRDYYRITKVFPIGSTEIDADVHPSKMVSSRDTIALSLAEKYKADVILTLSSFKTLLLLPPYENNWELIVTVKENDDGKKMVIIDKPLCSGPTRVREQTYRYFKYAARVKYTNFFPECPEETEIIQKRKVVVHDEDELFNDGNTDLDTLEGLSPPKKLTKIELVKPKIKKEEQLKEMEKGKDIEQGKERESESIVDVECAEMVNDIVDKIEEGNIEESLHKSVLEGKMEQPAVDGETEQSAVEGEIEQSAVEVEMEQSAVEGEMEQPAVDGETEQLALEGETEQSAVEGKTEQSAVEGETEQSALEEETEPSAVEGKTEQSAVEGKTEQPAVEGETEQSALEGEMEQSALEQSQETAKDIISKPEKCETENVDGSILTGAQNSSESEPEDLVIDLEQTPMMVESDSEEEKNSNDDDSIVESNVEREDDSQSKYIEKKSDFLPIITRSRAKLCRALNITDNTLSTPVTEISPSSPTSSNCGEGDEIKSPTVIPLNEEPTNDKLGVSMPLEPETAYPPVGCTENVQYSLFSLSNLKILFRGKTHALKAPLSKPFMIYPKLEFFAEYSAEENSPREICNQWATLLTHPGCQLLRVGINAKTSENIMMEELTMDDLLQSTDVLKLRLKPTNTLNQMHSLLERFLSLTPGSYYLCHNQNETVATLYKESDTKSFDLHSLIESRLEDIEDDNLYTKDSNWVNLNPGILLPPLIKLNKVPALFPLGSATSPSKKPKKKTKGKNGKKKQCKK